MAPGKALQNLFFNLTKKGKSKELTLMHCRFFHKLGPHHIKYSNLMLFLSIFFVCVNQVLHMFTEHSISTL